MCLILVRVSPRKPTFSRSRLTTVHSKTRTSVQLGILLGLSGDSGDGMGGGGGAAATGGEGAVLCIHLANQMQEGYIGARHFQTGQIRNKSPLNCGYP